MKFAAQRDLFSDAGETEAPVASADVAEIPPAVEPSIGPDILFDYHEASSGLWIVRAVHEPSGRVSRTTVGRIPVDEQLLEKLAKGARRAV